MKLNNADFDNVVIRSFQKSIFSATGVSISESNLRKIYKEAMKQDWTMQKFFLAMYDLVKKREAN